MKFQRCIENDQASSDLRSGFCSHKWWSRCSVHCLPRKSADASMGEIGYVHSNSLHFEKRRNVHRTRSFHANVNEWIIIIWKNPTYSFFFFLKIKSVQHPELRIYIRAQFLGIWTDLPNEPGFENACMFREGQTGQNSCPALANSQFIWAVQLPIVDTLPQISFPIEREFLFSSKFQHVFDLIIW